MARKKILIVDDDQPAAARIAEIATTWGWAAETAAPGNGAIEQLAGTPYDVVLADVSAADQDALDLVASLGQARPTAGLVAMNGHEYFNMEFEADLHKLGVVYYTIKPEHDMIMQRVIEHMLLRFESGEPPHPY